MISEYFLNRCLELIVSVDNEYAHTKELFSSIHGIIKWYKNQIPENVRPLDIKDKLELVFFLSRYRYENRNKEFNVLDLIDKLKTGKFKDLTVLLKSLKKDHVSREYIDEQFATILQKKKMAELLKDRVSFEKVLKDLELDNFETGEEVLREWDKLVTESYNTLLSIKRIETASTSTCLDLMNDNYEGVLGRFIESYNSAKILKTGYDAIDCQLPFGGLEKRRTYIFAGETGVGKSTILANIITNAVKLNVSKERETYLYITAENLIDESLIRFYCCMTGECAEDVVNKIINEPSFHKEMKKTIVDTLEVNNANIIFYYVEPRKTTLTEIESIVDEVKRNHILKAVFIDYLDLIRSGTGQTEVRHELGEVTLGFKQIAIAYDISLITATQLNRTGYNNAIPSITSMKESMRKAEDSDFVGFLQNPQTPIIKYKTSEGLIEAQVVRFTILKSRNGPVGFSSNFIMIKSIDGFKVFNYKFLPMPEIPKEDMISSEFETDEDNI